VSTFLVRSPSFVDVTDYALLRSEASFFSVRHTFFHPWSPIFFPFPPFSRTSRLEASIFMPMEDDLSSQSMTPIGQHDKWLDFLATRIRIVISSFLSRRACYDLRLLFFGPSIISYSVLILTPARTLNRSRPSFRRTMPCIPPPEPCVCPT